jgi:hypothetical protein
MCPRWINRVGASGKGTADAIIGALVAESGARDGCCLVEEYYQVSTMQGTMQDGLSLEGLLQLVVMVGCFWGIGLFIIGRIFGSPFVSVVGQRLIVFTVIPMVLGPFVWPYLSPPTQLAVLAVFAVVAGLMVLQGFGALLFGARAADAMVGSLAADLLRFVFKIPILPLRIIRRLLGG